MCGIAGFWERTRSRGRADLVALDLSMAMLKRARGRLRWWQRIPVRRRALHVVCADIERLPLAAGSVGLVWSNLALQWMGDLPGALRELHRVVAPGGLAMFSTFGRSVPKGPSATLPLVVNCISGRSKVRLLLALWRPPLASVTSVSVRPEKLP